MGTSCLPMYPLINLVECVIGVRAPHLQESFWGYGICIYHTFRKYACSNLTLAVQSLPAHAVSVPCMHALPCLIYDRANRQLQRRKNT